MYKDFRYINAGTNEVYRYGRKARAKVAECRQPNEKGFYSIPADGGAYWTIGTSEGKYGEFAKVAGGFLSVNKGGYVWAKEGTEKAEIFLAMIDAMIAEMEQLDADRIKALGVEEEEEN